MTDETNGRTHEIIGPVAPIVNPKRTLAAAVWVICAVLEGWGHEATDEPEMVGMT